MDSKGRGPLTLYDYSLMVLFVIMFIVVFVGVPAAIFVSLGLKVWQAILGGVFVLLVFVLSAPSQS